MTHNRSTEAATRAVKQKAEERRQQIVRLAQTGLSPEAIAAELKCNVRTVQRAIHGSAPRRRAYRQRMTDAEKSRARAMLEDGQSYNAVAHVMARCAKTIERHVPGYPKLTAAETAERAVLGRQLRRIEKRVRL